MRDRDALSKLRGKEYSDKRHCYKVSPIQVGDRVLLKRMLRTKWDSKNDSTEYVVTERHGNRVTVRSHQGKEFVRDVSQCLPLHPGSSAISEPTIEPIDTYEPPDEADPPPLEGPPEAPVLDENLPFSPPRASTPMNEAPQAPPRRGMQLRFRRI